MQANEPSHAVIEYAHGKVTVPIRTDDHTDAYLLSEVSTPDLERRRRDLRAQTGFAMGKPLALKQIMRQLEAINAEIDRRIVLAVVEGRSLCQSVVSGTCHPRHRPLRCGTHSLITM
ncbi:MAG: hypothetical protein JO345_17385 [Streptosporangiaceae bacterium]|nr:hypothetical protein [Streptosporangiaceae bacterium]